MQISALSDFLRYGPIGLAGLLLVLTIYALVSKNFDSAKERILNRILYVGAFCFVIAFIPQLVGGTQLFGGTHLLHISVDPALQDVAGDPALDPTVSINGEKIKARPITYSITRESTATIDVNKLVQAFDKQKRIIQQDLETLKQAKAREDQLLNQLRNIRITIRTAFDQVDAAVDGAVNNLTSLAGQVSGNLCYGGDHGVPSPDAARLLNETKGALDKVRSIPAILASLRQ